MLRIVWRSRASVVRFGSSSASRYWSISWADTTPLCWSAALTGKNAAASAEAQCETRMVDRWPQHDVATGPPSSHGQSCQCGRRYLTMRLSERIFDTTVEVAETGEYVWCRPPSLGR